MNEGERKDTLKFSRECGGKFRENDNGELVDEEGIVVFSWRDQVNEANISVKFYERAETAWKAARQSITDLPPEKRRARIRRLEEISEEFFRKIQENE